MNMKQDAGATDQPREKMSPPHYVVKVQSEPHGFGILHLRRKLLSIADGILSKRRRRGRGEEGTIAIGTEGVTNIKSALDFTQLDQQHAQQHFDALSAVPIPDANVWSPGKPDDSSDRGDPPLYKPLLVAESHSWDVSSISVALNVVFGRTREAVVALDGLVSEAQRKTLLTILTGDRGACAHTQSTPPGDRWDRRTSDGPGLPPSFGLRQSLLRRLQHAPPLAVLEIQGRLAKLYPDFEVCYMPEFGEESSGTTRTAFVANAAVHGDCK